MDLQVLQRLATGDVLIRSSSNPIEVLVGIDGIVSSIIFFIVNRIAPLGKGRGELFGE
jgi:hypothetical protein